jgi:hypothetical protein
LEGSGIEYVLPRRVFGFTEAGRYLSPRTVGSHLYRMFPKLGISSRAELGNVLSAGLSAS